VDHNCQGDGPPGAAPPADILQAVGFGVVAVDARRRITFFNQAAAQLTGIPAAEALGRPCREVLSSSLCDQACPLTRAMSSGQPQAACEAVFIRGQGRSVIPVKVSVTPLMDAQGRAVGGVETIQAQSVAGTVEEEDRYAWEDFVGVSPAVQRVFDVLRVVSPTRATILLEGPTGTGKDLLARIIHHNSPRAAQPFVKVNCAALPANLLESELFGYAKGAFTGAERDKPGRFGLAHGGTIFLDEISELPLELQAKLLRVIEEREFFPLGARQTTKVDVRILAACNQPLAQRVKEGRFREDLYYRLNVIRVQVAPLNERPQDVPLLIRRFIQQKNMANGTFICRFEPKALEILLNYPYPGNVRELENILEHACLLCQGDVVGVEHLPWSLREQTAPPDESAPAHPAEEPAASEARELVAALEAADWNRTRAAQYLGIDRTTLWRRMKRHRIQAP